jgi:NADH:ubiquinone oxidoreductase subunit 6 (subunit J)
MNWVVQIFSNVVVFLYNNWRIIVPLAAGALGVFFLLPRPRRYPAIRGALAGGAGLVLAGVLLVGTTALTVEAFLFYVFSGLAVLFGGLLVTQRKPARAALSFTVVVLATCGLFLLLAAPFLTAATVIIYAGAIIVTFLFVLMLAQQEGPSDADARSREPLLAVAVGFVLLGALLYVLQLQWNGQNDAVGRVLEAMVLNVREARAKLQDGGTAPDAAASRADLMKPLREALNAKEKQEHPPRPGADRDYDALLALRGRLERLFDGYPQGTAPPREEAEAALSRVETALLQARQQYGWPRPAEAAALSNLSGPPPNLPPDQARADPEADGRPYMPADNPGYLGRSLFTDYLLPVELGGFLLLVAVIGAVAIAQRRTTSEAPQ